MADAKYTLTRSRSTGTTLSHRERGRGSDVFSAEAEVAVVGATLVYGVDEFAWGFFGGAGGVSGVFGVAGIEAFLQMGRKADGLLRRLYVHRKGATRAFPAGHPALAGTRWHETGHPVLIPGSNKDWSYILRPEAGAVHSGYSVNHGAGRRMSRGEASRTLNQRDMDRAYAEAGILVNTNGRVPIDEAAPCYKPSADVIAAVVGAGLARVEYTLWPLASLKGDEGRQSRQGKKFGKKPSSPHY